MKSMKNFLSSWLGKILIFAVFGLSAYFINVEVQSYFGRQALDKTGLTRFTLDEAVTKASAENKRILVDVSAIWCPNCRRLDNEIFADENVKKTINEKFVFARLEYESPEGTEFLEKHDTNGFPNLWILDAKGNAVKQLRVTFNADEFIKQIQ
jgi:thiol:disulfide interchange protein